MDAAGTGSLEGGILGGSVLNLIGDKSAGKTLLALTILAEASQKGDLSEYELIYDEPESSCEFDIGKLFGRHFTERVEIPDPSETVEEFLSRIRKRAKSGDPFIYVLDSFDHISSDRELKKMDKKDGKDSSGFQTGKAIGASQLFRTCRKLIKQTESVLIIISQVRENIDAGAFAPKYRRSGGKALDHSADLIIWLATIEALKKEVRKRKRNIGQVVQARITKNRITGKKRTVEFPVRDGYGIDDVMANLDFLTQEGFWVRKDGKIQCPFTKENHSRSDLIDLIETKGLEGKLRQATFKAWEEIEEALKAERKRKYK